MARVNSPPTGFSSCLLWFSNGTERNLIIVTCSGMYRLNRNYPVVSDGGNRSTRRKHPPNPRSLVTFHMPQPVVVRDSEHSMATP